MDKQVKHIKVDRPMPESLKRALKAKKEWQAKVQSGGTSVPTQKLKRLV